MVLKALWRLNLAPKVKPILELEGYDEDDTRRFIGRETGAREENLGTSEVEDENLLIDWIDDWRKGEELAMNQVHWIGLPSHPEIQMSYIAVSILSCPSMGLPKSSHTDEVFSI